MLAIARAMMLEPKIILLDEPTEGLMPRMVSQIREIIGVLQREGVAVLLVEQNVPLTLEAGQRIYFIEKGVVRHHAPAAELQRRRRAVIHQIHGGVSRAMEWLHAVPLDQLLIQTINGIVTGMILALVASGLTLIFGIMDVVNFAHGEFFMLGAYVGVLILAATGNFWLALIVASLVIALLGAVDLRDDAAAVDRARPADDDPRDVRRLAGVAELRAVAVRPGGAQDPGADHRPVHPVLPRIPLVPAGDRRRCRRRSSAALWLFLKFGTYGHLDPRHDAGPDHGPGDGHPGAVGVGRRVRDRLGDGGGERRVVRPAGRRQSRDGARLGAAAFIVVVVGGMGSLGGSIARGDLHQPAGSLCLAVGEPGAGGHRLVRRADPDPAVPADRPFRADPEMSDRHALIYWTGFGVIVALLIVAPLVLPEFWRRFLTEILIWGLLAMSSDILIGYTGMVSFGHSAFFGLGMYGAAAALLTTSPPSLWLAFALRAGRGGRGRRLCRLFLDPAARHLFRDHDADLLADILRHHLHLDRADRRRERAQLQPPGAGDPGLFSCRFTPTTLHWFVLAVVVLSYLLLRRITQSPFGMVLQSIRENEARTRAIGYPIERYKIVAVMLSGLFAGLAGVLYALQNQFAAPDFVFFVVSGEVVIYNVIGGIGTLVGPIARRRLLPAAARGLFALLHRIST